ncbi:hypothetical protein [Bradyrhizobium sp. dw_411]|uniref:hypothetical protein n=1 Tax=Bradyrhizobium sp. dw_411 TaxID=2720082 RepID=UPI001BD046CE|nr:hypothetical protein [Bradyrhizobium sp. dw_411]
MSSEVAQTHLVIGIVFAVPLACLCLFGLYLQWQGRQIYNRIGDYSIGLVTFYCQLDYPGQNFPRLNVLEAKIAAQPADLQANVQVYRRRSSRFRWALLSYFGLLAGLGLVSLLARKLNA